MREIACIDVVLWVWCGCSVPAAEWLDSSAVGTAHAAGESMLCCERWRRGSSQITLGFLVGSLIMLRWREELSCITVWDYVVRRW